MSQLLRSIPFSFWMIVSLIVLEGHADSVPITFQLESKQRVSLAIYDSSGRLVRTLMNASPLDAGTHCAHWDGLDSDGQPVPRGRYEWKMIAGQGLQSEYLLSLGTSFSEEHWPGQHGGPMGVDAYGDNIYVSSAGHEGAPMFASVSRNGEYRWSSAVGGPWPQNRDIAVSQEGVFVFETSNNKLYVLDKDTGMVLRSQEFAPIVLRLDFGKGKISPGSVQVGLESYRPERGFGWETRDGLELGNTLDGDPFLADFVRFVPDMTDANEEGAPVFLIDVPKGRYQVRTYWGDGETEFSAIEVLEYKLAWKSRLSTEAIPANGAHKQAQFNAGSNGQLRLMIRNKDTERQGWALRGIEILKSPDTIDANFGILAAGSSLGNELYWIDSSTLEITDSAKTPDIRGVAVRSEDEVLVLTESKIISVDRATKRMKVRIDDLDEPTAIDIDTSHGDLWVAVAGNTHQVLRFDSKFQLKARYGRMGGRQFGKYCPQDFRDIKNIAADGCGGFLITEQMGPRRTAHFDRQGNLLNEWYGGQQFYTYASPDPHDPSLVWMDTQWNQIMQIKVDYESGTWKPLAVFNWNEKLYSNLAVGRKMAKRHHVVRYDANRDGEDETYLWSEAHSGLFLKPDMNTGTMWPVVLVGEVVTETQGKPVASKDLPAEWCALVRRYGLDPSDPRETKEMTLLTWSDVDGDCRLDQEEIRLARVSKRRLTQEKSDFKKMAHLDSDFDIYFPSRGPATSGEEAVPILLKLPCLGRTKAGHPIYDFQHATTSVMRSDCYSAVDLYTDPAGAIYQLTHDGGDGYEAKGVTNLGGHGQSWPSTLNDAASLIKWSQDGRMLWKVGTKAAGLFDHMPAQLHHPVNILGLVKNEFIGVCDKVELPLEVWTTDGLYVGGLFDRRVHDGRGREAYSWWRATKGISDEQRQCLGYAEGEIRRSILQYDMILGGNWVEQPDGSILYYGCGWNNVPVYRVNGWDRYSRAQGWLEVEDSSAGASRTGSGLTGAYFAEGGPVGDADLTRVDGQLWFGQHGKKPGVWPEVPVVDKSFSVRWTGQVEAKFSEKYWFHLYVGRDQNRANGVELARLWVGDRLLLDTSGGAKAPIKQRSAPFCMVAGTKYPIRVEYSSSGDGELHLVWESTSQAIEHIPMEFLYPKHGMQVSSAKGITALMN